MFKDILQGHHRGDIKIKLQPGLYSGFLLKTAALSQARRVEIPSDAGKKACLASLITAQTWLDLERATAGFQAAGRRVGLPGASRNISGLEVGPTAASPVTIQSGHNAVTTLWGHRGTKKPWPRRGGKKHIPPSTQARPPSASHLPLHAPEICHSESPLQLFLLSSMLHIECIPEKGKARQGTIIPPTHTQQCYPNRFPSFHRGLEREHRPSHCILKLEAGTQAHPTVRSKSTCFNGCQPQFPQDSRR